MPDFSIEAMCNGHVAGVDEVGRGPMAGPVVAAAVILDKENIPSALNDSKKLSKAARERLSDEIFMKAISYGVAQASVEEIDELNILQASLLAMRRAVAALSLQPDYCLIDGNQDPGLRQPSRCVVKGDGISASIAAASIIAKVTRDKIMADLAQDYPAYGWDKNAGYCVAAHKEALTLVGVSPHHRRSFAPVREILLQGSGTII